MSERKEVCSVCNWTNINLMNVGSPEQGEVLICHGCIKREHESISALQSTIDGYRSDHELVEDLRRWIGWSRHEMFEKFNPPLTAYAQQVARLEEENKRLEKELAQMKEWTRTGRLVRIP